MLAKQGEDQMGCLFGREELLDWSISNSANPYFQRRLTLYVTIPIRFPLPPGHHEHLICLSIIVQNLQNRPADQATLAATMGNLHEAIRRLGVHDQKMLPVVDRGNARHPIGILGRDDIFQAYSVARLSEQV